MIPPLLLAPLGGVILALLSRAPWQAALGTAVGATGLLSGAVIQGMAPRVAVEATALFAAPLIYLHGDRRGMEAAWKYLLICSVGIAFAFLGIIFLSRAA